MFNSLDNMNIKKRLTKEVTIIGLIFLISWVIITLLFLQFSSSLNNLIKESDPALNAMEHMLLDVYQDNILLLDYLNTDDYDYAIELDEEVALSNERCKAVENEVENLIVTNILTDRNLIKDYNEANSIHHNVGKIRDKLLILHKKEIATKKDLTKDKTKLLEEHSSLFKQAVDKFTNNIEVLNQRNELLRNKLMHQSKIYFGVMIVLLFSLLLTIIYKIRKISNQIIKPLDDTINTTTKFVDGDYEVRLDPSDDISEINELQSNINNVFGVIENVADNPKEKERIEFDLLRQEYIDIITYIKSRNIEKKQVTITDLKKHLGVTHPTVLTKLDFLKNKEYITVKKDGREKFLQLTSKSTKF